MAPRSLLLIKTERPKSAALSGALVLYFCLVLSQPDTLLIVWCAIVFTLTKKKPQRCTFSKSACALVWQLSLERFNAVLLFLRTFLSPRFLASSPPSPHSRPPSRQGSLDSASMLSGEGCCVPLGHDAPQLHTRVSVGKLRSALLQQSGAQPDKVYAHLHVCAIILCTSVFAFASTFSSLSSSRSLCGR